MAIEPDVRVKVEFDKKSLLHLNRSLKRTADISKLAFAQGRLEKLLVRRTKARFLPAGTHENAQKDPSGTPWKALSPTTIRSKGARKPILVRSGLLHRTIRVVRSNLRSKVAVSSPTGARALIGVPAGSPAAKYAGFHQFGGVQGNTYTPQRRFLGVGPKDAAAVQRLLDRIALEQLEG